MNRPLIAVLLGLVAFWITVTIVIVALVTAPAQRPAQDSRPAAPSRQTDDGGTPAVAGLPGLDSGPDRYPDRSAATASLDPVAAVPSPPAVVPVRRVATISGLATWFASPVNVSAAGPVLRRALGPGWRGTHVRVCSGSRCVVTVLGDWCRCGPRGGVPTVIDLDDDAFRRLAPLSRGTIPVTVGTIPAPPATATSTAGLAIHRDATASRRARRSTAR